MKLKLLLTFALLLTAVTGAWADVTLQDGDVWDEATKTLTVNSDPADGFYSGNGEIQHLVIASGVTSIGESAFGDHGVGSTDHFLKFLYYTSFLTPHDPTSKFST